MITIYFGSPGAGKTTLACREIFKANKHYLYTFANFGCKCATADDVDLSLLGKYTFPPNSYLAIDEAGIEYNNRKFKSLSQDTIKWFKLHRHYKIDVSVWSQSWEDMDVVLRRLATKLYYIRKIGPFTLQRRVYKRVTIDKQTEQIIDGYKMVSMLWLFLKPLYYASFLVGIGFLAKLLLPFDEIKLIWRRRYYKYFDTHDAPPLPLFSNSFIGNSSRSDDMYSQTPSQGVKTPTPHLFSVASLLKVTSPIHRACDKIRTLVRKK